jgi:hypothetical protein
MGITSRDRPGKFEKQASLQPGLQQTLGVDGGEALTVVVGIRTDD